MSRRIISFETVKRAVCELCSAAACDLPPDVFHALECAREQEKQPLAQGFFDQYLDNAQIAARERMPLCQDTGFAVFFVERGTGVELDRGTLEQAINAGVAEGYQKFYLRKSIVSDPIFERKNSLDNTPAIVHLDEVGGDRLHIVLAPKGGGSENMSAIAMLKPSDGVDGVIDFVARTVIGAGGNPCPPVVVGVGVGGTFEKCAFLAKKALLRTMGEHHADPRYAELESRILERINASGVGAQGLGGDITALAVNIEYHPCHIASMPVAVNINCHAARHSEVTL